MATLMLLNVFYKNKLFYQDFKNFIIRELVMKKVKLNDFFFSNLNLASVCKSRDGLKQRRVYVGGDTPFVSPVQSLY